MAVISAHEISKSFPASGDSGSPVEVVKDIDLELDAGELVTVFGPNGCGKTTFLNILAGLTTIDSGSITFGKDRSKIDPVGYVFQNYSDTLLPWRTVRQNVEFPLELGGRGAANQWPDIDEHLSQFRLNDHAEKYIYELSGGLKQLVSIARSTVYEPQLLLLDEPFSALDYSISRELWAGFRKFWSQRRVTTVFVSHNIDEAIYLGDRVLVLTSRPARLIADIPIPLRRNRDLSVVTTPEFFDLRRRVLTAFEEGHSE